MNLTTQSSDHTRSIALMEEARRVTPGGINTSIRKTPVDIVFRRAAGAYMWDVDGNKYLDYHAAFGPIILGHANPQIDQAVTDALQQIDLVGTGTTEYEIEVARKIVRAIERPVPEVWPFAPSRWALGLSSLAPRWVDRMLARRVVVRSD